MSLDGRCHINSAVWSQYMHGYIKYFKWHINIFKNLHHECFSPWFWDQVSLKHAKSVENSTKLLPTIGKITHKKTIFNSTVVNDTVEFDSGASVTPHSCCFTNNISAKFKSCSRILYPIGKLTLPLTLGSVPDMIFCRKRNPTYVAPQLPFCSFFYPLTTYPTQKTMGDGWVGFFRSPCEGRRENEPSISHGFSTRNNS